MNARVNEYCLAPTLISPRGERGDLNSEANLLLSDTQGTPGLAALLFSMFDSMVAYFTLDLAMPLLGAFSNDDEEYVWSSIVIVSTAGRGSPSSLAALSASLVLSDSPAKFKRLLL